MTDQKNLKEINNVPLTKWSKHFEYPTQGTMRNIVARRNSNNAMEFLTMVHGRYYVNVQKFNEWWSKQK